MALAGKISLLDGQWQQVPVVVRSTKASREFGLLMSEIPCICCELVGKFSGLLRENGFRQVEVDNGFLVAEQRKDLRLSKHGVVQVQASRGAQALWESNTRAFDPFFVSQLGIIGAE